MFSSPQIEVTKRLLSADELARELGVGRTTAYALLWSGQIPSMKVGRLRKVRREDAEAFIQARMERSGMARILGRSRHRIGTIGSSATRGDHP